MKPCVVSWRTAAAATEPPSQYTITGFVLYRFKVSPAVMSWFDGICRAPLMWPAAKASGGRTSSTSAPRFMSWISCCGVTPPADCVRSHASYTMTAKAAAAAAATSTG